METLLCLLFSPSFLPQRGATRAMALTPEATQPRQHETH
jgi:hypothetical protein